jgi:thiamine biosynthesis lipoprotein
MRTLLHLDLSPATGTWALALAAVCTPAVQAGTQDVVGDMGPVAVERRIAAMGTELVLVVEAPSRGEALAASESALRAIELVEQRLSTWRADSELSRLNRSAVGEPSPLSPELAQDLATVRRWVRATGGGFDPAVGALVEAWDLRGIGRIPTAEQRRAAVVPGGMLAALRLEALEAVRLDPRLCLEEGAFGKGAGLDAARTAFAESAATRATMDFGGQIAWFWRDANATTARGSVAGGSPDSSRSLEIADPRDRALPILALRTVRASAATSSNSERGSKVRDARAGASTGELGLVGPGDAIGHLLDPRSGDLAPDFGSVTVLAGRAIDADCLSTGLFVLGPDRALALARELPDVDVVVIECLADGRLRVRASPAVEAEIDVLDPRVDFARSTETSTSAGKALPASDRSDNPKNP